MENRRRVRRMYLLLGLLVLVLPFTTGSGCHEWVRIENADRCFEGQFQGESVTLSLHFAVTDDDDFLVRVWGEIHSSNEEQPWVRMDFEGYMVEFGRAQVNFVPAYRDDPDDPDVATEAQVHSASVLLPPDDRTLECSARGTLEFVIQYVDGVYPEERYALTRVAE